MTAPIYLTEADARKIKADHQRLMRITQELQQKQAAQARFATPIPFLIGKADATITPDESGEVNIWRLWNGEVEAAGYTETAHDWFGTGAVEGAKLTLHRHQQSGRLYFKMHGSLLGKAGSPIAARTGDTPGSGTVTIWMPPEEPGAWVESESTVTAYNFTSDSVGAGTFVELTPVSGVWVISRTVMNKARFIKFTLTGAISSASANSPSATISDFWDGPDPGATTTVYNRETAAAGVYSYAGDSGATGWAVYDGGVYWIIDLDCPA